MEPTKERLARDLKAAGAPAFMVRKAKAGEYDDYESNSATPIINLVRDLSATGRPALLRLAEAARGGAYDGTKEESEAWFEREGKDLLGGHSAS